MNKFVKWSCLMLFTALLLASCKKDESGSVAFDATAIYLQAGESVDVGFSGSNIKSFSITSTPTGWDDPVINTQTNRITITAPRSFDDDVVKSGSFTLSGAVNGGGTVTATLFAGVVTSSDLSVKPANSFLLNKPETQYTFDAMHQGDGKTTLATASVAVIWQSASSLIQYLQFNNGEASFYIGADSDDDTLIKSGNALIGAYNAAGDLIWSWHIWATNYDPNAAEGTVTLNGYTMMTRNLGALSNSTESTDEILTSYGLYYQWGRKEPFIGPSTYQASNGSSATMYNGSNSRVTLQTVDASASTGTAAYALQNPLTFICGVEGSNYDWMWAHDNTLWSSSKKSATDPCPNGWTVAPGAAYADLKLVGTPTAADYDKYGWLLTDGTAQSLFMALGKRIYLNSTIQNTYNPLPVRNEALEAQPWIGYYWSSNNASADQSQAFTFWFNKQAPAASGTQATATWRANGMQVRCVKQQ